MGPRAPRYSGLRGSSSRSSSTSMISRRSSIAQWGTKHRRTDHGERDLSDCQCDGAGHDANKQRAQDASAAVKRGHAGGKPDEERQRVNSKRENQPAKQADPEHAEDESDDKHGGSLRDKGCDGRAFHHHHGAVQSIAKGSPSCESDAAEPGCLSWGRRRVTRRPRRISRPEYRASSPCRRGCPGCPYPGSEGRRSAGPRASRRCA